MTEVEENKKLVEQYREKGWLTCAACSGLRAAASIVVCEDCREAIEAYVWEAMKDECFKSDYLHAGFAPMYLQALWKQGLAMRRALAESHDRFMQALEEEPCKKKP